MGGLLHLVQRGGTWAGCCNSLPINGQCTVRHWDVFMILAPDINIQTCLLTYQLHIIRFGTIITRGCQNVLNLDFWTYIFGQKMFQALAADFYLCSERITCRLLVYFTRYSVLKIVGCIVGMSSKRHCSLYILLQRDIDIASIKQSIGACRWRCCSYECPPSCSVLSSPKPWREAKIKLAQIFLHRS